MKIQHSKYQSLSIKRKLEIIDDVEKAPAGKKKKEIATEFGIPTSTLCGILKKKGDLKESMSYGRNSRKRNRDISQADVDA